jgi:hypothetical protein
MSCFAVLYEDPEYDVGPDDDEDWPEPDCDELDDSYDPFETVNS